MQIANHAMLIPEGSLGATMLVRRSNGQFAFERIDARVAAASRVAASWIRKDPVSPAAPEGARVG